jgi:hypothetical protein
MASLSKSAKAYGGWFLTLLSGFCMGFGVGILLVIRIFVERWGVGDPSAYSDLHLYVVILVFIGLVLGGIGIYEIYSSLKTVSPQPSITTLAEKKYCRFCGTENKKDAVFCEKCGKKISET